MRASGRHLEASAVSSMGVGKVACSINLMGLHPLKQVCHQADVLTA